MYALTTHEIDWKAENLSEQINVNSAILQRESEAARSAGSLLGRIVQHQVADGYAVYQIVKVNKTSVRVRHCTGLGDDYTFRMWGAGCSVPMRDILRLVRPN
jgi:hypothetical protein